MANSAPGSLSGDVRLRDVTEADLPTFFEQQLDPVANRMAAFPARDRDTFMAHWTRILADETLVKQTILFDGQVAGNIVSFEQSGQREVGYWIGRQYWGRGIGTRALAAFLRHVEARPLYAHAAQHNVASIRVLQKCGFTIAGEDRWFSEAGREAVDAFILKLSANTSDESH